MKTKILLTSFQTWLPHQKSNSSDDLLAAVQKLNYSTNVSLFFLRNLPVDVRLASQSVIAEIQRIQPHVVICCGMAEKRNKLTIESQAWCENECLNTEIDLSKLNQKLVSTEISHDAGKFVCEGLYYQILKYIQTPNKNIDCVFVHVPKLEDNNSNAVLEDFQRLINWFSVRS